MKLSFGIRVKLIGSVGKLDHAVQKDNIFNEEQVNKIRSRRFYCTGNAFMELTMFLRNPGETPDQESDVTVGGEPESSFPSFTACPDLIIYDVRTSGFNRDGMDQRLRK